MKCKLFGDSYLYDVERKINQFLEENSDIQIHHVTQIISHDNFIMVTIFYSENY